MLNHQRILCLALAGASLTLAACASTTPPQAQAPVAEATPAWHTVPNQAFAAIQASDSKQEQDRLAILAMQGEYQVDFHFEETVPLMAGYQRFDQKDADAFEMVLVVENQPELVVLQHLLVGESGHVIKHWRQDWHYQAESRFEFIADQTWARLPLDEAATSGRWTQCVFEVSDAPRYCGTGRWNHKYGVSTWTSDRTWRPLPRREYTKRDDYNALNVENRHTVTPSGWTHEQDNTKAVRNGTATDHTLVREFGFNDYRRIEGFNFQPGYDYWAETSDYWALVRSAWSRRLNGPAPLVLKTEVDGLPIIQGSFEMAKQVAETTPAQQRQAIEDLLNQWTTAGDPQLLATLDD